MNVHDRTLFAWTCQHVFCFVPVFAWMSLKEILRGRLNCFYFVLASGRRQFERGLQWFFRFELYFTIFIFWHEGSNTKRF